MGRRGFPELETYAKDADLDAALAPGRGGGSSGRALGVLKFLLGVCLLPFVYAVSAAFLFQLSRLEPQAQRYLWQGAVSFLVLYLFVWEPAAIYSRGHKLIAFIFNFVKPLVKTAPYLLPIYTLLVFILYQLLSLTAQIPGLLRYAVFALGFTMVLHLVFSARSMRAKKGDFLKANYLFGFSIVYILNISLFAFLLSIIFLPFSFIAFCNQSYQDAAAVFSAVFRQLFL